MWFPRYTSEQTYTLIDRQTDIHTDKLTATLYNLWDEGRNQTDNQL